MALPLLIIDMDRHATEILRAMIEATGISCRAAYDRDEVARLDLESGFAAVMADPAFGDFNGMDIFKYLAKRVPNLFVAALISGADPEAEEFWRKKGADAVLPKPYREEKVASVLIEIESSVGEIAPVRGFHGMIGDSQEMRSVFALLESIADTDTSVLIEGETGVGKELIARAIHDMSKRRYRRFVTVNCAALTESLLESELFGHEKGAFTGAIKAKKGKFEYAAGGTVFLDEIGEINNSVQAKLLKVIETGEVERVGSNQVISTNTRMIFATNKSLSEEVAAGRFRSDLFYRINVMPIKAPPLKERTEDIPALARFFLDRYAKRHDRLIDSISPMAMKKLIEYRWPGNVRELEKIIERAVITTKTTDIEAEEITLGAKHDAEAENMGEFFSLSYKEMTKQVIKPYEKKYFSKLLTASAGNVSEAAKKAQLDRKTFYYKMSAAGLDPATFRKRHDER